MKFYLPSNMPARPDIVYKDKGWTGVSDFLGTGNGKPKTVENTKSDAESLDKLATDTLLKMYSAKQRDEPFDLGSIEKLIRDKMIELDFITTIITSDKEIRYKMTSKASELAALMLS